MVITVFTLHLYDLLEVKGPLGLLLVRKIDRHDFMLRFYYVQFNFLSGFGILFFVVLGNAIELLRVDGLLLQREA